MSKLVTVYGGSGFVGRYIARRLAKDGWRVRVAVRNPNEAMFVKPYGAVGQVEPVFCNIRDDESVRSVMHGSDAVVNCVGVLDEIGKNTFEAVQAGGAERIARIAALMGVGAMVQMSAIGADADSESEYARTKAAGEAGALAHMPNAMMSRFGPVLPIVGADTKFQPVYVDDVAAAAVMGVQGRATGVFELGGPEVHTMRELMNEMLAIIRRRRLVLNIPFFAARMMAFGFKVGRTLSLGLVRGPITADQVKNLRIDNVVSDGAQGFEVLGITPTAMEVILPDYLWRFRPSGQFDAIKESAKNLRT